ncbi:MAG: hypothetical protein ACK5VK_03655 [Cyclobacteriaceae bacterium]
MNLKPEKATNMIALRGVLPTHKIFCNGNISSTLFQISFVFLMALASGYNAAGQTAASYVQLQPITPSPEAAKLAQFDLAAPNLYTGARTITVPIYEIGFDGGKIPLSLSYSTGGIRASENAGIVGLGWALSTGGSISRTTQGLNDLHSGNGFLGYCFDPIPVPDQLQNWTGFDWIDPYYSHYLRGLVDTEPDMYSYNFLGSSGKFILSKASQTGNVVEVIKVTFNGDKLVFNNANQTFTVTSPEGVVGVFAAKEYTTAVGGSNGNANRTACDGQYVDVLQTVNQGGRGITSWYLTQITTPSGKVINFNYHLRPDGLSDYISISSKSWGEARTISTPYRGSGFEADLVMDFYQQSCSRAITENVYLSSIVSADLGLEINFQYASRLDIENMSPSVPLYASWFLPIGAVRGHTINFTQPPMRCIGVRVRNTLGGASYDVTSTFNQSYFGNTATGNPDNLRLKLNSVTVGDQTHSFEYFDGLPNKSTLGVDYWGYYNGRDNNQALLPVLTYFPPHSLCPYAFTPQNYYFQTEDRAANFAFGKAGLLNKVTYPTGGYTQFEFESHEYKLEGREALPPPSNTFSVSGLATDQTVTFNYIGLDRVNGCSGPVTLQLSTKCKDFFLGNNCTIAGGDVNLVAAQLIGPSGNVVKELRYDFQYGLQTNQYQTEVVYNLSSTAGSVQLTEAGTYSLKAFGVRVNGQTRYYGDATISLSSTCITASPPTIVDVVRNQKSGGTRVKSITMYDADHRQLLKRSYTYTMTDHTGTFSSGRLMNPLMDMKVKMGGTPGDWIWVWTSGSSISKGSAAQGSHLGYSQVIESLLDETGNVRGIATHQFRNDPNYIAAWGMSMQAAIANQSFEETNGISLLETQSTNAGEALKHTYQDATFVKVGHINALKVNWMTGGQGGARSPDLMSFYKINRGMSQVVRRITTIRVTDPTERTQVTKEFMEYNGINQLVRNTVKDNNDVILRTEEFRRPIDYANPAPIITTMKGRNILSPVIESMVTRNGSSEGQGILPNPSSVSYSVSGLNTDQTVNIPYKGFGVDGCNGPIMLQLSTKCKDHFLGANCAIQGSHVNLVAAQLLSQTGNVINELRYDFQYGLQANHYQTQYDYNISPTATGSSYPFWHPGTYTIKGNGVRQNGQVLYYGDATISIPSSCVVTNIPVLGDVVSAEAVKYKLENNLVVPEKVYKFNRDRGAFTPSSNGENFAGGYEEQATIARYDDQGNALEIIGKDGVVTSFIWGYANKKLFPVAKLVGVSRNQVDAVLGTNFHSGLGALSAAAVTSLTSAFPSNQLTFFTYNPGSGLASTTDANGRVTYYEYDNLGRLKVIKDHNTALLKSFEYNYQTQN